MTEPDATMTRIGKGTELNQHGDREATRAVFAQLWSDFGGEPCNYLGWRGLVDSNGSAYLGALAKACVALVTH